MSHTLDLINEALDKIHHYLKVEKNNQAISNHKGSGINKFTEKFGVHLMRAKQWKRFEYTNSGKLSCIDFYNFAINKSQMFDNFYDMLADNFSKKEYDWFVKYRVAYTFLGGGSAYELFTPRITNEEFERLSKSIKRSGNLYKIDGLLIQEDVEHLVDAFFIEQYKFNNIVEPEAGDVVFDIGACFGDTALWFSKSVKSEGQVYAFEPVEYNSHVLEKNIERNSIENITIVRAGAGDKEQMMNVVGIGGGAFITNEDSKGENVKITTIDNFVERHKIERVDFIKMDIEGAELSALKGAEKTIKKFKPKLAICVYHKGDDLITIPKYLKSINEHYKFYLKHNRPGISETVMYAISK